MRRMQAINSRNNFIHSEYPVLCFYSIKWSGSLFDNVSGSLSMYCCSTKDQTVSDKMKIKVKRKRWKASLISSNNYPLSIKMQFGFVKYMFIFGFSFDLILHYEFLYTLVRNTPYVLKLLVKWLNSYISILMYFDFVNSHYYDFNVKRLQ